MEEIQPSTAAPPLTTDNSSDKGQDTPPASGVKKGCLSFGASLVEYFRYTKAFFVRQAKKLTARSEKEIAEADLQASKMEVEAADAAEETKKRLDKSD
ncbi:uncharacterized protein LOC116013366 [Ipomoea triloba]|uniref:uncharacterized protein LOC116013366 n=1 Tax=Ipomoea triloba TaxID=35885 RepID=UPI00125CEEB6|nr:uncharacterized protein LOC116013366 [Ipomoea triloba]